MRMSNPHPKRPGRPTGITKAKLSITINSGLIKKARKKAADRNTTLSATIQSALQQYLNEVTP